MTCLGKFQNQIFYVWSIKKIYIIYIYTKYSVFYNELKSQFTIKYSVPY